MNAAVDQVARSLRPEVRNPVLKLPAAARLQSLDQGAKDALRAILMDIRTEAQFNAAKCWRTHKAPMAVYWKVVAVYAGHIARALRAKPDLGSGVE